ncbi:MAG: family 43 glycosylhydrolase [Chthoniobacteraceae bacterium]
MLAGSAFAAPQTINPGEIWPDDRGEHIQAHGGGVIKLGDTWYWFGEDRGKDKPPGKPCVACYSSEDLAHWKFRNRVVVADDPAKLGKYWILERPKVYYNAPTKKFVMYAHIDSGNYKYASVAVFTCDTVDGNYQYLKNFRPLGLESRDIGQFIDDDGSAYLLFESRPSHGFYIAKLSDDYLDVKQQICFLNARLEADALVHYDGLYYAVGSWMSGWNANPNVYATATSLAGPWSEFKDIAPKWSNTYGSQTTMLLKVTGTRGTTVIYMADRWRPSSQWDSRYLWMPVEIGGGNFHVLWPKPWKIDAVTGEAAIIPVAGKASPAGKPAP